MFKMQLTEKDGSAGNPITVYYSRVVYTCNLAARKGVRWSIRTCPCSQEKKRAHLDWQTML